MAGSGRESLSTCGVGCPALNPASSHITSSPLEIAGFNHSSLHFQVYLLHSWRFGANEVDVRLASRVPLSPALSAHFSTGNCPLGTSQSEASKLKAGEKVGVCLELSI